jgi:ATP-dependent DNA ligase
VVVQLIGKNRIMWASGHSSGYIKPAAHATRRRARPRWSRSQSGFVEPCLPSPAERPPTGPEWVHEIKHDGYRLLGRRDPVGIRLLTRNGHDWAPRYPLIVEAVNALKVRSCLIDGEAVVCDEDGRAVFERLRKVRRSRQVFLCAFDLLELDWTCRANHWR